MNEKIKEHVKKYCESKGYPTDDDNIIEAIQDAVIWSGDFDEHRHWTECLSVSKVDDMLIGFDDARSDGDMNAEDKGWEFDPESICEVESHEETVTTYKRILKGEPV